MTNRSVLIRGASVVAALSALAVPAFTARLGATEKQDKEPTIIRVQKLHDAGGLIPTEKDQQPLNESLTTGFVQYLSEHKQNVTVWDGRNRDLVNPRSGQKLFTLEGDLSRRAGEEPNKDTYLLTLRLYDEEMPRHLLAQWSGSARSLIYLTNNLHHDSRFSIDGLLGELGGRVLQTVQALDSHAREEQQQRLNKMLTKIKSAGEDIHASVLSAASTSEEKLGMTLTSGQPYRLSLCSHSDAEIYILARQDGGLVQPLLVPKEGQEQCVTREQPLTLPVQGEWRAPETPKSKTLELILLERRREEHRGKETPRTLLQQAGLEDEQDVQVISGGNSLPSDKVMDADIAHLMARIQAASPQTWRILRLKLQISSQ